MSSMRLPAQRLAATKTGSLSATAVIRRNQTALAASSSPLQLEVLLSSHSLSLLSLSFGRGSKSKSHDWWKDRQHQSARSFHVSTGFLESARPAESTQSSGNSNRSNNSNSNSNNNSQGNTRQQQTQATNWRQIIKPFLLKCHPDVIASQSPETVRNTSNTFQLIQTTNLKAIQNLNNYLDTVQAMLHAIQNNDTTFRPPTASSSSSSTGKDSMVLLDFILIHKDFEAKIKKNQDVPLVMTRRKMELAWPDAKLLQTTTAAANMSEAAMKRKREARILELKRHVVIQLLQLLRVAGLEVSTDLKQQLQREENERLMALAKIRQSGRGAAGDASTHDGKYSRQRYLANKRAWWARVNWAKVDELSEQADRDMQALIVTKDLYANDPELRLRTVAAILAKIQVQRYGNHDHLAADDSATNNTKPLISLREELIAFRRMSLLLEDNFEDLLLEDLGGAWWDSLQMILTPERPYNTSSSALHKRTKLRAGDNGFSLTWHATVGRAAGAAGAATPVATMTIPVDFRDEELLSEWRRNVEDYQRLLGDGMEEIFYNYDTDPLAAAAAESDFWKECDWTR